MDTTTLGLFHTQESAENAINELSRNGIPSQDISIIMKDQERAESVSEATGVQVAEGVTTGVTTGGILGGVAGLLVGIGAITIPGLGGVLIAGPLASTISGALTGVLAGGLLGGLIVLGLPKDEALLYETDIKTGAILLGVPTTETSMITVKQILEKHHASQIRSVSKNSVLL